MQRHPIFRVFAHFLGNKKRLFFAHYIALIDNGFFQEVRRSKACRPIFAISEI